MKSPYTQQWNVSIDQSLGDSQKLTLAYIGSVGRRLLRQVVTQMPNPNFVNFRFTSNDATSGYNGLQAQFVRRLSRGFQTMGSYTWAHSIDSASSDYADLDPGRASSNFDIRHTYNIAASYDIPGPKQRALNVVFGHWSMDTMLTGRTGSPFSVIGATETLPGGSRLTRRPNIVPGQPLWVDDPNVAEGRKLNRAAFVLPSEKVQGNLPRNSLQGFGAWQLDVTVRRQFKITERVGLQYRAEFFNLFNHPNFGPPERRLASGLFGQSTATLAQSLGAGGNNGGFNPLFQIGGPRSIQMALKLQF